MVCLEYAKKFRHISIAQEQILNLRKINFTAQAGSLRRNQLECLEVNGG